MYQDLRARGEKKPVTWDSWPILAAGIFILQAAIGLAQSEWQAGRAISNPPVTDSDYGDAVVIVTGETPGTYLIPQVDTKFSISFLETTAEKEYSIKVLESSPTMQKLDAGIVDITMKAVDEDTVVFDFAVPPEQSVLGQFFVSAEDGATSLTLMPDVDGMILEKGDVPRILHIIAPRVYKRSRQEKVEMIVPIDGGAEGDRVRVYIGRRERTQEEIMTIDLSAWLKPVPRAWRMAAIRSGR